MTIWALLWIVPLSVAAGMFLAALLTANGSEDN